MNKEELKEALYNRYIVPTTKKKENYIGIEIEMPVVNLTGRATDFDVTRSVTKEFCEEFGFLAQGFDENGYAYSSTEPITGDNLSFDCSYNNLEFSFAKEKSLEPIAERFKQYITALNKKLEKHGHLLTGMGINPGYKVNENVFLPVPRYQMLEGYLRRSKRWEYPMYFHKYPDFGAYACASQVQLDVTKDRLIQTIDAFSLLEPIKSILFANSWMDEEPDVLCMRDMFWENSTHGINPHNIGVFEKLPEDIDELMEYIYRTSIFCTERNGHYLHFHPIPVTEYFSQQEIIGEYYEDGTYHPYRFKPGESDLQFLRTYKFEDLTFRGTIEYRSGCCQPFSDAMTIAAFHVGLSEVLDEVTDLFKNDDVLYHHGYTSGELRKIMNRRILPDFIDKEALKVLCKEVLNLAQMGLSKRGFGEEKYLDSIYERAETLVSPGRKLADGIMSGRKMKDFIYEFASV
ncbi:MAG: glutamylcysteine synthetase [Lachnospiraceae bacterium]|nr:glutamylcysteine synthetase [Lachnospiraceae bacterium]